MSSISLPIYLFMAIFAYIGMHYTYKSIMFRYVYNKPFSDPDMQRAAASLPPHRSVVKAMAAFVAAIGLGLICYSSN